MTSIMERASPNSGTAGNVRQRAVPVALLIDVNRLVRRPGGYVVVTDENGVDLRRFCRLTQQAGRRWTRRTRWTSSAESGPVGMIRLWTYRQSARTASSPSGRTASKRRSGVRTGYSADSGRAVPETVGNPVGHRRAANPHPARYPPTRYARVTVCSTLLPSVSTAFARSDT